MHRSFGIETRPTSMIWQDIIGGPSIREVRSSIDQVSVAAGGTGALSGGGRGTVGSVTPQSSRPLP